MQRIRRFIGIRGRLAVALAISSAALAHAPAAHAAEGGCFRMFDATAYAGKPDLVQRGIEPTNAFEPDRWWPKGSADDDLPDPSAAQHWMLDIGRGRGQLVLDLERWWLRGDAATVRERMRRYTTVLGWIRAAGYSGPIGFYGVVPIWDRARAIQPEGSAEREAWRRENDFVQPVADRVDVLFPSLYTPDEDVQTWKRFAIANLREARRLAHGKPVYPFLWPQYEGSNKRLALQNIPREQWAQELEVVGANADGAVIWGGIGTSKDSGAPQWDESAQWWQATLDFLSRRGKCHAAFAAHKSPPG
jgi:Hyaluronidase